MPRIVILVLVLLGMAGATAAFVFRPASTPLPRLTANPSQQNLEQQDLLKTREFLNLGKPEEAVAIIQEHADDIDYKTEMGREWLDLLVRASEATLNIPQLLALNDYYSKSFDAHEKAALLIASHYLTTNRAKDFQALRDNWIGRESKPEAWFVLDVDKLLGDGKRKEAIDLLHSRSFPGKSDSTRLIRLALLYAYEEPKTAWDYLTQAYAKDPENPDIRSYRAKLLETVGKMPLALSEYRAAIQADPQNPYLKDQLAEFFVRTEQYPEALQIWSDQIKSSSQDSTWLKALFWSRVTQPIAFDWKADKVPQGKLEPLIRYLLAMQPGTFWNNSAFERLPEWQNYLSSQQATFWFRLLDDLKLGKEKEAYDLLQYNPFSSVSWNPKLEQELKRILQYRQSGQFAREEKPLKLTDSEDPYFNAIDAMAQTPNDIPHDLHDLLKGPEAFAMAFMAAGWNEAGLGLHEMQVIPPTYPDWVAVEIAKAMRENRGDSAALKFATVQPTSPSLSLLIGETYLAKGNQEAALKYLSQLKGQNSDAGYRASWLLSLLEIERGQYDDAKAAIHEQPRLAQDVLGKETLARIALLEGDTPTAEALYISLEKVSTEAQSYLARKAFFDKNWKRARMLTENLLRQYPDNPMLQQNLAKIKEEQKRQQ
ncbi:MAG: tetratricopeptide repeat protein [Parachlamydia sp.]|nr:tetratricopeptide repeat protein [Parachlamydia sp.]